MKPLLLALLCFVLHLAQAEELHFYGQFKQDRHVYEHFFKDKRGGIFVDIGAHDGITLSNTYFFEKTLGWSGLCIEPLPEVFARLKANRNCLCIEGCILDDREEVAFLKITGYAEMLSGIIENYDRQHVKRINREVRAHRDKTEEIRVKCYNLTRLLLDNHLEHVDYLSIDTEGSEWEILRSIDFTQIDIEIIDVENNYQRPFEAYLAPFGYRKVGQLGPDEIYQKIKY